MKNLLEKLDKAKFLDLQKAPVNDITYGCFGDDSCFCDNHVAKANCIGCVNATPENYDLKRSEVYEM